MEVILKTDIPKLGKAGDVVRVRDGYARNYLIPKGLAIPANPKNIKALERQRKMIIAKTEREKKKYESFAKKLEGAVITLYRKKIEEDRIYGSVSASDIVSALKEKGIEIDKRFVSLADPIKRLGSYEVSIKLPYDQSAVIKVEIIEEK